MPGAAFSEIDGRSSTVTFHPYPKPFGCLELALARYVSVRSHMVRHMSGHRLYRSTYCADSRIKRTRMCRNAQLMVHRDNGCQWDLLA